MMYSHRVVLAAQNDDPLLDFLLGGIETTEVRDNIFCLLPINPVVLLMVRWARRSVKRTCENPARLYSTQKHPSAPYLSHNIVFESSRIEKRGTTADAPKE